MIVNSITVLKKHKINDLRLSLDIGTNSIGWALYNLNKSKEPISFSQAGVRIFSEGRNFKDKTTLNSKRREARLQRRQRDRYLQRRSSLLYLLKNEGFLPKDKEENKELIKLNPYELRAKGLTEKLEIHQFGRAVFHLNQKRGFKSNRKSSDMKESGLVSSSVKATKGLMEKDGSRTYGEFLWKRFQKMEKIRKEGAGSQEENWVLARRSVDAKSKDNYAVYALRKMIEEEFNMLWDAQSQFHKKLKEEALKNKFFKCIFYQRNLKKPIVGICPFTKEKRVAKALPSFQRFRILKELNNLAYKNKKYQNFAVNKLPRGLEFRDKVIKDLFLTKKKVTFSALTKDFRRFFPEIENFKKFNLEAETRTFLDGEQTAVVLRKIINNWDEWSLKKQDKFVEILEGENRSEGDAEEKFMKSDEEVLTDLQAFNKTANLNLSDEQLEDSINQLNKLPNDRGMYSKELISKLLPLLEKGCLEHEALKELGYHHSDIRYKGELLNKLPRYQKILGDHCVQMSLNPDPNNADRTYRIPNPTVHIALNQLRLLVNDIIKVHGHPRETVVETARDLPKGKIGRKEQEKFQSENKKKNEESNKFLEEFNLKLNRDNRFRHQLWEEQGNVCIYSGKHIPQTALFTNQIEIDHILPFSKSLDNGRSNKVLVYRSSNQNKSDQTPFESFSSDTDQWEAILARIDRLPESKQWRFEEKAMEIFKEEGGFLARQLNDTRYISRYAMQYLERVCENVWSVRGQTTALLRDVLYDWQDRVKDQDQGQTTALLHDELRFKKNRDTHKNHAQDAIVLGLVNRSFLQKISSEAGKGTSGEKLRDMIQYKNIIPWKTFRKDAKDIMNKIIVSHKQRTKKEGQLHNDTAYGFSKGTEDFSKPIDVIHYVDILAFEKKLKNSEKKIEEGIVSKKIKLDFLKELEVNGKISKEFLIKYHKKTGVRRIRFQEKETVIGIKNKEGYCYKAFREGGNYAVELFEVPDGKWDANIISIFEVNQKEFKLPSKKRLLRKGEMFFFDKKIWKLVKFDNNKNLCFAGHFETNLTERMKKDSKNPFKFISKKPHQLQKQKMKRAYISPSGQVKLEDFKFEKKPENPDKIMSNVS